MSKKLTEYKPKNLADPRIKTIPLEPVKQLIAEREQYDKELLESKEKEIEKLKQVIYELEKKRKRENHYKIFYDALSLECLNDRLYRKITLIECAEKIRRGECYENTGCQRKALLEKLYARSVFY